MKAESVICVSHGSKLAHTELCQQNSTRSMPALIKVSQTYIRNSSVLQADPASQTLSTRGLVPLYAGRLFTRASKYAGSLSQGQRTARRWGNKGTGEWTSTSAHHRLFSAI